MKKENRRLAQQRRAAQRKKQAMYRILRKVLAVVIPVAAVVVIILLANLPLAESASSSDSSADSTSSSSGASSSSATSSSSESSSSSDYSTDTSLSVEDGDTVNIDYVGTIDGVEFSGGNTQGNGTDLVIGSGSYIDDFEEQLIGSHPGDTVEVTVTFPDDYSPNPDLAGQEAVFTVTVNGIYTG